MFLGLDQQALRFQPGHDLLARAEAVQALVGLRRLVIDLGVQREDGDHRQPVAQADLVVVLVVRRGDLDHAGAKGLVS